MTHLSEEELVERYYRDGAAADGAEDRHVEECEECAAALAALESDLNAVRRMDVPERDGNYGDTIWKRVSSLLPESGAVLSVAKGAELLGDREVPQGLKPGIFKWRANGTTEVAPLREKLLRENRPLLWRGLGYAAGCAVLVAGAFYVGTVWEHQQHLRQDAARAAEHATPPVQQRVVVVVLGDHLDRSERLLVELKHADAEDPELVKPLREEARNLLAANREFRDDAEKTGDPALTKALGHLDTLLTEMANGPQGLNAAAIERLQKQMNEDGLLFEVRVLRSKNPHRESAVRVLARGGTA
ncbi:MAG TPA: hypothetical protein VG225_06045 [Terracidiphilus sp.]|jgi:hypothetical protein|nr:hypothetical protein [Terracidiphilus sp.]